MYLLIFIFLLLSPFGTTNALAADNNLPDILEKSDIVRSMVYKRATTNTQDEIKDKEVIMNCNSASFIDVADNVLGEYLTEIIDVVDTRYDMVGYDIKKLAIRIRSLDEFFSYVSEREIKETRFLIGFVTFSLIVLLSIAMLYKKIIDINNTQIKMLMIYDDLKRKMEEKKE